MVVLEEAIKYLDYLGVWNVIIPFIFVFTLVYAVLERTKVLGTEAGKPKHRFNAMFAFVIAFTVLISVNVLNVINIITQYMVVVLVALMLLALLLGLMGFKGFKQNIVIAIGVIITGAIILYILGYLQFISLTQLRRYLEGPLIAIIILLLLVWFVLKGPSEKEKPPRPEPSH